MRYAFLIFLFSNAMFSGAQDTSVVLQGSVETTIECPCFCDFPKIEPQFPGGNAAFSYYINEHIIYPENVPERFRNGTVVVRFMVTADGRISEVKVHESLCPELDKAATNVISGMPAWTPGEKAGKRVRTRFEVPIKFTYQ